MLAADAVQAFNSALASFDTSGLDGNGDGFIDNVLVIPEVGDNASTTASAAYPRQMEYGGSLFVGSGTRAVPVRSYTVVDTSHLISTGTIVHETLHAFGAKDLHRSQALSSTNHAVGVWDIMAARSESRLMRPLAITLQDCGWREIEAVAPGAYTIAAPGSAERSVVRLSSGLSGTEYFVAKFRKANSDISDLSTLDATAGENSASTIGGSGPVVYRVNPFMREYGNKASGSYGEKDYVYVFRRGETTNVGVRGDGVGDLRNAQLSLTTGYTRLGTDGVAKGFEDGYTRSNWELIDGAWYHFDRSGWMQTGWIRKGKPGISCLAPGP